MIINDHLAKGCNRILDFRLLNQAETRLLLHLIFLFSRLIQYLLFNPHPVNLQMFPYLLTTTITFLPFLVPSYELLPIAFPPSVCILPRLPPLPCLLKIFPFLFALLPSSGLAWRDVTTHLSPSTHSYSPRPSLSFFYPLTLRYFPGEVPNRHPTWYTSHPFCFMSEEVKVSGEDRKEGWREKEGSCGRYMYIEH